MPIKTLAEIIKSGGFHPTVQRRLEQAENGPQNGPDSPGLPGRQSLSGAGYAKRWSRPWTG